MNLKLQKLSKMSMAFLMALFSVWGWAQTPFIMANGNYSENFDDIANWANGFASGTGAAPWKSVIINTSSGTTIGDGVRITTSSANFTTTTSGGVQKGTSNLVFLSTGTNNSVAADLYLNFSSRNAGTLSFNPATVFNSNGNRDSVLKVFYSINSGSTFTELAGTGLPYTARNNVANSSTVNVSLPTSLNNISTVVLRFYEYSTSAGASSPSGSQPKISIDNLSVTSTAANIPTITPTGTFSAFSYVQGSGPSASQSVSVSGNNLDNSQVIVNAPTNYEVSLTNGNDFDTNQIISYSGGVFTSQNIYVRLKSGLAVGAYSGDVTISGGNVATTTNIAVNGNVTTVPTVTASTFSGVVGTGFSHNIVATQNPTSYALVAGSNLPVGLTLNTATGEISGNPTSAGAFTTNVIATNDSGNSNPATITITVDKGTQTLAGFSNTNKYLSSPAFTFPLNTDNANLAIAYSSSNTAVATVSGNTVTITGIGTTNITATQAGNNDWNALNQQIVLTVSADPITYNGVGRFEKITSLAELTDGYYVIAYGSSQAMNNTYSSSVLGNTAITVVSDVIANPSTSIVWKIATNGASKSIFNEVTSKYISYTGSSNNVQVVDNVTTNNQLWDISYLSSLFVFANNAITNRDLQYNAGSPRFACYTGSQQNLTLYKLIETTTWNGTTWSNGSPDNKDVIIAGPYATSTSTPGFTAKNITIKNGGALEITNTYIVAGAEVIVENGGNLIQKDGSTLTSSSFKVLRNSASVAGKYVFWSSPVADQNLYKAYTNVPLGTAPTYVMTYDTATNLYPNVINDDANFTANAGKGYSVKVPANGASVSFGGSAKIPNNGNVNVALSTASFGYNLIGNPYPSNIDLTAFYNANSSSIAPTMWLWDNTTGNVTTQTGNTAVNVGYATFNGPSGTWTEAPSTTGYNNAALNGIGAFAKIGQGFIVKAISAGSATFTNAIRASNTAVTLNKNLNNTEGKFWVKLTTSYGNSVTQAITYSQGASDAYDVYDSKAMGIGSDAFYSVVGTEKLVIQGRAPFNVNDVVQLGNKHFENGNFTISLSHKEGLFTNGQEIYLHDKQSGTYTNLQNGTYNFLANAGDFTNRFEIVYKLNVLSTNEAVKGAFEVYKDGEDFVVRNNKNIQSVEVFDATGRKIQQITSNSKSVTIKIQARGMYILKAVSEGKEYTQKIIK